MVEFLLAVCEFASATVINTKAIHDAVDDKKAVLVTGERLGERVEELELVLKVESTRQAAILIEAAAYAPHY